MYVYYILDNNLPNSRLLLGLVKNEKVDETNANGSSCLWSMGLR